MASKFFYSLSKQVQKSQLLCHFGDFMFNDARYTAISSHLRMGRGRMCMGGAVCEWAGAVFWVGRGCDTQKLRFWPI